MLFIHVTLSALAELANRPNPIAVMTVASLWVRNVLLLSPGLLVVHTLIDWEALDRRRGPRH
jgi:hypothetical protein